MKIENSYFVKTINDVFVWLAVGKEIPEGARVIEERPMLIPEEGMVLRNKQNGAISSGHWLRNGDNADNWEEIEEPKEPGAE
jgi:hypothetical protein